jgi:transposase
MFLKHQTVPAKNGKVYNYVYLTESYRDARGRSRHRHIANLSGLSERELANFELALQAGKRGEAVVVREDVGDSIARVADNYRYLDVAVLLEVWRDWRLDELCEKLMPRGNQAIAPADVVGALTFQRALEPDSKLAAVDWFAQTALPELTGVAPSAFNNTRIHRVLDDLDAVGTQLQMGLAQRCVEKTGIFATVFLDGTDTFFVGRGPELAKMGKTKEGRMELKIGIVLLCNERGEPLRWDVVEGTSAENRNFRKLFDSLAQVDWVQRVPVVVDRAMGHTADIEAMLGTGLHFVTALTANEFDTYAPEIPRAEVGGMSLHLLEDKECEDADRSQLVALVQSHGLQQVGEDLLLRDLGVREMRVAAPAPQGRANPAKSPYEALEQGHEIRRKLDAKEIRSYAHAAQVYDRSAAWVETRTVLTRLSSIIQDDISSCNAEHLPLVGLIKIARRPLEEQMTAYLALKDERRDSPRSSHEGPSRPPIASEADPREVRHVLYFNPDLHVQKRRNLLERIEEARLYVHHLNEDIVKGRKRLGTARLCAEVEAKLVKLKLSRAFDVVARTDGALELVEDEGYLIHLRGRFGFCLIVAHRDTLETPEDLVRLYRAKNTVERDFKTIKSCVELRPVRHRTTSKVRAHVTLCMLALLLHRSLEARLGKLKLTAPNALGKLHACALNRFEDPEIYTMTRPRTEQLKILKCLNLLPLADDQATATRLRTRKSL